MTRPVAAFLRAVNLGGHNRVPMAALRELVGELGHPGSRTHVQSGNLVLDTDDDSAGWRNEFAETLRAALAERFGVDEPVVMRTRAQLASLERRNPYLAVQDDPTKVHVLFLAGPPSAAALERVTARPAAPDEFTVDGEEVFVHYPNGAGRSRLRLDLGVAATARNWRTVCAVLQLM